MIKIAIEGADTKIAGDLIRILILHPDVEIISLASEKNIGRSMQSVHYGLEGERCINFTSQPDYEKADVIFLCSGIVSISDIENQYPELKIIYAAERNSIFSGNAVMGFSEIFRKELVRGAKSAYVPMPATSLVLDMLFPLAKSLMLDTKAAIEVRLSANPDMLDNRKLDVAGKEIVSALKHVQNSFDGDIHFVTAHGGATDMLHGSTQLPAVTDLTHLERLYNDAYSDHNFSLRSINSVKGVAGTQKILYTVSVNETEGQFEISADCDPEMRGSAGEAVHIMNLMCGFHEKTGLAFRAAALRK